MPLLRGQTPEPLQEGESKRIRTVEAVVNVVHHVAQPAPALAGVTIVVTSGAFSAEGSNLTLNQGDLGNSAGSVEGLFGLIAHDVDPVVNKRRLELKLTNQGADALLAK